MWCHCPVRLMIFLELSSTMKIVCSRRKMQEEDTLLSPRHFQSSPAEDEPTISRATCDVPPPVTEIYMDRWTFFDLSLVQASHKPEFRTLLIYPACSASQKRSCSVGVAPLTAAPHKEHSLTCNTFHNKFAYALKT